jgi:mono/diheme cytochrome c family protein
MMALRGTLILGCLTVVGALTACSSSSASTASGNPAPSTGAAESVVETPQMINEGRGLFATTARCGICHGRYARGTPVGPDLTDDQWLWVNTRGNLHNQIFAIIKNGISNPREHEGFMPPMGGTTLTDEQMHAIAAYVANL